MAGTSQNFSAQFNGGPLGGNTKFQRYTTELKGYAPIGSFGGALKDVSAVDLGAVVIREAIARAKVKPADIGDVVMGCVLQAGVGSGASRRDLSE